MSDREKVINDMQKQIEDLEERLAIVLDGQPEIVLCEDCKHHYEHDCEIWNDGVYNPEWFCADGERKK